MHVSWKKDTYKDIENNTKLRAQIDTLKALIDDNRRAINMILQVTKYHTDADITTDEVKRYLQFNEKSIENNVRLNMIKISSDDYTECAASNLSKCAAYKQNISNFWNFDAFNVTDLKQLDTVPPMAISELDEQLFPCIVFRLDDDGSNKVHYYKSKPNTNNIHIWPVILKHDDADKLQCFFCNILWFWCQKTEIKSATKDCIITLNQSRFNPAFSHELMTKVDDASMSSDDFTTHHLEQYCTHRTQLAYLYAQKNIKTENWFYAPDAQFRVNGQRMLICHSTQDGTNRAMECSMLTQNNDHVIMYFKIPKHDETNSKWTIVHSAGFVVSWDQLQYAKQLIPCDRSQLPLEKIDPLHGANAQYRFKTFTDESLIQYCITVVNIEYERPLFIHFTHFAWTKLGMLHALGVPMKYVELEGDCTTDTEPMYFRERPASDAIDDYKACQIYTGNHIFMVHDIEPTSEQKMVRQTLTTADIMRQRGISEEDVLLYNILKEAKKFNSVIKKT